MAGPKGYSSYRGRKSLVKILVAILLVLVILAAAGFILLQRYIVYDDSGAPHLQFAQGRGDAASSAESSGEESVNVTIDEPEKTSPPHVVALTDLPLTDWQSAQARLGQENDGGVCLTVKDASGAVYYDSITAAALNSYAVKAAASTADAILAMTGSDCYTVAKLSALRDSAAARAELENMGLKNTGGFVFYDGNNENWLDPGKQGTRDYISALAVECASLGFDEILLTDFTYPTVGKLNKIDYGTGERPQNLTALVQAVRETLTSSGYGRVALSVELPAAVIRSGSDEAAGLVLAQLVPCVDRIYAETDAAEAPALEAAVTAAKSGERDTLFVPEVSDAGTLETYLLLP